MIDVFVMLCWCSELVMKLDVFMFFMNVFRVVVVVLLWFFGMFIVCWIIMKCLLSRCRLGVFVVLVLSCCFMLVVIFSCCLMNVDMMVCDVGVCMICVVFSLWVRNRLYVLLLLMVMWLCGWLMFVLVWIGEVLGMR